MVQDNVAKLAVLVSLETNENSEAVKTFSKQLSMHIAASNPLALESNLIDQAIIDKIKDNIRFSNSIRHVPAKIIKVSDIPRTRSGKIAEITVRDIINGMNIKNLEALANPACLSEYENIEELKN